MANNYLFIVFLLACFTYSSNAYQFPVGGRNGWSLNPVESYSHWSSRLRFSVNDTLLFKYNKQSDSVLLVNKPDYDTCNTTNPIIKLEDGNSIFKFDHSGPFYFISGNKTNCDQGQKLIIVVLAVRNHPPPPAPVATPPAPFSPSPSPVTGAPAPIPGATPPSEAPTPAAYGPAPSIATSPVSGPSTSPAGAPSAGGTPADVNSHHRSLAAPACTPAGVLVVIFSLVLSMGIMT